METYDVILFFERNFPVWANENIVASSFEEARKYFENLGIEFVQIAKQVKVEYLEPESTI